MFGKLKSLASSFWSRYRRLSLFWQMILFFPFLCAAAFTLIVGNMGLAIMGTAIALNSIVVGYIGGLMVVVLTKAGLIVAKDKKRNSDATKKMRTPSRCEGSA